MAAFVLDAMSMNADFQRALMNVIVAGHPELWSGVLSRIMDDLSSYELRKYLLPPWLSVGIGPQRSICNNSNGRFDLTAPVFLNETLLDFANLHGIQ
ncbi:hypothetical protein TNCV_255341 [Trichonephila clavipes]|nr:hypothetical protein TNCV_255341 [Trichonephila clavipes]